MEVIAYEENITNCMAEFGHAFELQILIMLRMIIFSCWKNTE